MVRGSPYAALYTICTQYPACHQWQFIRRVDKNTLYALVSEPGKAGRRRGI